MSEVYANVYAIPKASENATTAVGSTLSGNKIVIQTGTVQADGSLDRAGTATTIQGSQLLASDSINIHTGELNVLNSKDDVQGCTNVAGAGCARATPPSAKTKPNTAT